MFEYVEFMCVLNIKVGLKIKLTNQGKSDISAVHIILLSHFYNLQEIVTCT